MYNSIPPDQPETGTSGGGSLCQQADLSATAIRQLETRPTGNGHRWFHSGLDGDEGLCQPSMEPDGRVLARTRQQQAELVLVAPVWKAQGWYPVLLEMLVKVPLLIPLKGNLITATHKDSLPEVCSSTSHVDYLRQRYKDCQVSEGATKLLLASWRQKSSKT